MNLKRKKYYKFKTMIYKTRIYSVFYFVLIPIRSQIDSLFKVFIRFYFLVGKEFSENNKKCSERFIEISLAIN